MQNSIQTIETLKKGDYFKTLGRDGVTASKTVYVYDGYNRFTRKYSYYKSDDINAFGEKKKGSLVTTNFEF